MGADISFLYKYEHLFRKERTMNLTGPRKILYFLVVRVGPTTKQMPTRCVFRSIAAFEPHTLSPIAPSQDAALGQGGN